MTNFFKKRIVFENTAEKTKFVQKGGVVGGGDCIMPLKCCSCCCYILFFCVCFLEIEIIFGSSKLCVELSRSMLFQIFTSPHCSGHSFCMLSCIFFFFPFVFSLLLPFLHLLYLLVQLLLGSTIPFRVFA